MAQILAREETCTDEEVIARVLAGEKELYELIMRRYNQRLFRISRAYVRDADAAEEVVQQAYINAYEHLASFEGRSKFSTWLTRIVINEALRKQRDQERLRPLEIYSSIEEDYDVQFPSPHGEDPAERVMNDELRTILERTIDTLPQKYRSVFMMREIEEMSIAETSESLGISPGNVKVRLNRAKEMLRDRIGTFYRDAGAFHFDLIRCDRIVNRVLEHIERS